MAFKLIGISLFLQLKLLNYFSYLNFFEWVAKRYKALLPLSGEFDKFWSIVWDRLKHQQVFRS